MNISKELLSEVLRRPVEILDFDEAKCEVRNSISFENYQLGVSYIYLHGNKETRFMPIHELQHRCLLHFYDDYMFDIGSYEIKVTKIIAFEEPIEVYSQSWMEIPYDIQRTFDACQWILDNKDV